MKLSVIIVNYNVKYFIEQCLNSVFNYNDLEVFVVDNASSDGSVEYLKSKFPQSDYPQLHIIANRVNCGFGCANNIAARKAKGEYILFLNPDTLLTEHTLADCVAFADEHSDLGALGVMMHNDNGTFARESRRGFPTPWVAFCKMSGLLNIFPKSKRFGYYYMGHLPLDKPNPIEVVSGAFMMVRNDGRDKWFDEDFFMHAEDIDLSYRLKKEGKCNYFFPTPIIHYKGESLKKTSFRHVHVFYEAMFIFFKKHFGHYSLFLSVPIRLAIFARACMALLQIQTRALRNFFNPVQNDMTVTCLYLGQYKEDLAEIASNNGLVMDYMDFDEQKLQEVLASRKYLLLIFDADTTSTGKMIETIIKNAGTVSLATYIPKEGLLLTGSEDFRR